MLPSPDGVSAKKESQVAGVPLARPFDGRQSLIEIEYDDDSPRDIDSHAPLSPDQLQLEPLLLTPDQSLLNMDSKVDPHAEVDSEEEYVTYTDAARLSVEQASHKTTPQGATNNTGGQGHPGIPNSDAPVSSATPEQPPATTTDEYVRVSRMMAGAEAQLLDSAEELIGQRATSQELRARLLRPEKLPKVEFDVVKINVRGRRQPRVLRLTMQHVQNVRGAEVSSQHTYLQILRVITINVQTFSIEYVDGLHPYTYVSDNCLWLVQELAHRVDLHTRRHSELHFNSVLFQEELRASVLVQQQEELDDELDAATRRETVITKLDLLTGISHRQRLRDCAVKLLLEGTLSSVVATFITNAKKSKKRGEERAHSFRVFCDGIRFHIFETNSDVLRQLISGNFEEEKIQELLSDSVEYAMEQTILQHFSLELAQEYRKTFEENDAKFQQHFLSLVDATQEDFDVPVALRHPTAYIQVSIELSQLRVEALPSSSLEQLLKAVKVLYFAAAKVAPSLTLSADDFFPLFVHCLIRSQLKTPHAFVAMIWVLADPERLRGEAGYYLTQLESAIFYITRGVEFQAKKPE